MRIRMVAIRLSTWAWGLGLLYLGPLTKVTFYPLEGKEREYKRPTELSLARLRAVIENGRADGSRLVRVVPFYYRHSMSVIYLFDFDGGDDEGAISAIGLDNA